MARRPTARLAPECRPLRVPALALLALLVGCTGEAGPPPTAAAAAALLEDLHARGLFNGAVVLGRGDTIVYEGAWGPADAAAGRALTPDTPVDGASLAKNFTATAAWLLVEDGVLDLDAPVQRYLPEFPHAATTVRHLIAHAGGLPDREELPARYGPDTMSNARLVAVLRETATPPSFPPGSRFAYCNSCFDVAALVVERVSGMAYDAFLRRRVLAPLGMDSTFLRPARLADWRGARTMSYGRRRGERVTLDVVDGEAFYGSANLYFSARDLHRWATSFYAHPVLRPETLARALEVPVPGGERSPFNLLAWYHAPEGDRFYFSGHHLGFHHEVYWDRRRRFSIVWVSNDAEARPHHQLLTLALVDVMEGRPPARLDAPRPADTSAGLAAIDGTYELEGTGPMSVRTTDGEVFIRLGDGAEHRCFGAIGCYAPDFDARIDFSDLRGGQYQRADWISVFRVSTGRRRQP